jgi:hypothetical protein
MLRMPANASAICSATQKGYNNAKDVPTSQSKKSCPPFEKYLWQAAYTYGMVAQSTPSH